MTILICSGTLYSDWRKILKKHVSTDSSRISVHAEISTLNKEICEEQFPDSDELDWKPFTPNSKYINQARQLFSNIESDSLFTWDDSNSCLHLNFWKTAAENVKFVLFYSSPELELSNYISNHPFEASRIEKIINAWLVQTRAMLTFFMNNRGRCLLVDVCGADFSEDAFIHALNNQFDLDLESNLLVTPQLNKNSALIEFLATTLLLKNQHVSELYDEVRSAATLISNQDKSISSIKDRNNTLIPEFLTEVTAYKQLNETQTKLEEELTLNQLQINQMAEELERYYRKSIEQEKVIDTMTEYLSNDPLLKIAHQIRQKP